MVVDRNLARRAAVHAALADPARLAVVDELCLADRAPSELGASLGMASNLLAHHLRVLEGVGLVERVVSEGDRRRRYLRLRPEAAPFAARTPLVARSIVFVCTANSARSPLAAALWNQRHLPSATSAGTHPGTALHPRAVAAARALGLELGATRPRALGP
ncbi:MAG: helix-turn-helix domain-containing protein, partial [Acidimicrobiales bacterium]